MAVDHAKMPVINVKELESKINSIGKLDRTTCPFCGNDTFSAGMKTYWVCSHCECAIHGPSLAVAPRQGAAGEPVFEINKLVDGGNYEGAMLAYENLAKTNANPTQCCPTANNQFPQ